MIKIYLVTSDGGIRYCSTPLKAAEYIIELLDGQMLAGAISAAHLAQSIEREANFSQTNVANGIRISTRDVYE